MSGRIPAWLAERLGLPSAPGADSTVWYLDTAWSWAPWATVLLILAAILLVIALYARESSGTGRPYRALLAGLRLTALAIVLIMLAQWALALRITGPPSIALVIDRSASMGITDHYAQSELPASIHERLAANGLSEPTRINLAKLLVSANDGKLLSELTNRYRLQLYFAAVGVERIPFTEGTAGQLRAVGELVSDGPGSHATRLGDALRYVLDDFRGAPPTAIILISDGVTTEGLPLADAAQLARHKGTPLFTVGLGSALPPRDIELADVLVDDVVFVNDTVSFQVQINASGLEGELATLVLRRNGDSSPLVEKAIVLPPAGRTLTERLTDRPAEAGQITYIVEIAPRHDETNPQNNSQRRIVDVRDEKIRVLLAYGYPNYEFRFLKTLLERDPTIALATYVQDADPQYAEQDKTALRSFPVNREELFEFDVIVAGDVDPRLLPRSLWQIVRVFVTEKGGGVAFLAGPRYLPWLYSDNPDVSALLPIDLSDLSIAAGDSLPGVIASGFVVQPTALGLQNPAMQLGDTVAETEQIWRSLPELYWLYQVDDLKPGAQLLAQSARGTLPSALTNPPFPLICFQFVGVGRVLFHAIDSTWRWRLGAGDVYFARYWVQTIRFLARGKLASGSGVQLTTDRREYPRHERIEIRARFLDPRLAPTVDEATVFVDAPGQPQRRVVLRRAQATQNLFHASLADLPDGRYEVVLAEPQLPGDPPIARFTVTAPPGEFARLQMDAAALSAAAQATRGKFYTIADVAKLLDDLPAGRRVPIENLPPISLWNRWWMLATFVIVVVAEWILRKRKGML